MNNIYKLNTFNYTNTNDMISSDKILLKGVSMLMEHTNDSIHQLKIEMYTKDPNKENKECDTKEKNNSVIIDIDTMNIIKVNGCDPNCLCEFLSFINNIVHLDPLMDTDTYKRFRDTFTKLYYNAYFNGKFDKQYALDTDEIQKILSYRHFNVQILSDNINGKIFYRLVYGDSDITVQSWIDKLKAYECNKEDMEVNHKLDQLTLELTEFVKCFHMTYESLTNTEWRTFTTGFKNLYNHHVDVNDKYEKICINNINNILKSLRIPYTVSRQKEFYYISKTDKEET